MKFQFVQHFLLHNQYMFPLIIIFDDVKKFIYLTPKSKEAKYKQDYGVCSKMYNIFSLTINKNPTSGAQISSYFEARSIAVVPTN